MTLLLLACTLCEAHVMSWAIMGEKVVDTCLNDLRLPIWISRISQCGVLKQCDVRVRMLHVQLIVWIACCLRVLRNSCDHQCACACVMELRTLMLLKLMGNDNTVSERMVSASWLQLCLIDA